MRGPASSRVARLVILLAGLILGQAILYGPSLIGRKVLLPLDILAQPTIYLPQTPEFASIRPQNPSLTDLIDLFEPDRRFAVAEWRAGRIPMWVPYGYGGAPFIWPKFSPFLAFECCAESPVVLAWGALLAALLAGVGAYRFFRRVLTVSFWPAALCAWCYPLTGFFIFWQGYATSLAVYWLPWLLLAVHATVRGANPLAPIGLSLVTCLVLISGHPDVGCQALLGGGLFALSCLWDALPKPSLGQHTVRDSRGSSLRGAVLRPLLWQQIWKSVLKLAAGWALGWLLAAPYLLPSLEYSHTGARMARRSAGAEERPPAGLNALPQVVLPDLYGNLAQGSIRLKDEHQNESAAATYAGVIATLVLAPLALRSGRHRSLNRFWLCLSLFALSWCLDLPGFVQLLRLPGLNLMSHNRLVFLASFAILALAAVGLELVCQGLVEWRLWMWLPQAALAGCCLWCLYRATHLPEPLATRLAAIVQQGGSLNFVHDLPGVEQAQARFIHDYLVGAFWCGVGFLAWLWLRCNSGKPGLTFVCLGSLAVADLVCFAWGRNVQSDPALYYPRLPVLEAVANASPDRSIGLGCLPPNVAAPCGLRDIRGYDAVDPARMVALLKLAAHSASPQFEFASSLELIPKARATPAGDMQLSPILDMLSVRYVILRGSPRPNTRPVFQGPDYWVLANPSALPRVFVPRRVETLTNDEVRLEKIASPQFDPREVAYVESPVDLPPTCQGAAQLLEDQPTRIRIALQMTTPGLVVLTDLWDQGWRAWVDGKPTPILRANHAIRGVVVPAEARTLEFRYVPASFRFGLGLAGVAGGILLCWLAVVRSGARRSRRLNVEEPSRPES